MSCLVRSRIYTFCFLFFPHPCNSTFHHHRPSFYFCIIVFSTALLFVYEIYPQIIKSTDKISLEQTSLTNNHKTINY